MSGLRVSTVAPHFGFIPIKSLAFYQLNKLTPTIVGNDPEGALTGDIYVPFNSRQPWTLKTKYEQLPRSDYTYEADFNLTYPSLKKLLLKQYGHSKATAELCDLLLLILEQMVEGKSKPLFNTTVPTLDYHFSKKQWAPIKQLFHHKQKIFPSEPGHYQSELAEFLLEVDKIQAKQGKSLPPQLREQIIAILTGQELTKTGIQTVLKLSGLPPVPIEKMIRYALFKARGRMLMDTVFPGKDNVAKNKRKAALALPEAAEATVLFSQKTWGQKAEYGFEKIVAKAIKPVVQYYEGWQPTVLN